MNDISDDRGGSSAAAGTKDERFGTLIREYRHSKGISQVDLARRCGITSAQISMIERGERSPSDKLCWQLAEALDADAEELVLARMGLSSTKRGEESRMRDPRLKELERRLLYLRKKLPRKEYLGILSSIMTLLSPREKAETEDRSG